MNWIRLDARTDRNGNSRRCYVILNDRSDIEDVIPDEGNHVRDIWNKYPNLVGIWGPTFITTPMEYRSLISPNAEWRKAKLRRNQGKGNMFEGKGL